MLRDAGIHEGMWTLIIGFRMGAGSFGPTPDEVAPSAFVGIESFGIQKVEVQTDQPVPPMTFSAAELNPRH